MHIPEPDEYSGNAQHAAKVIEASTRILLYTLQSLLIAHLDGISFYVEIREDEDGQLLSEDVHFVLRSLHIASRKSYDSQLPLFKLLAEER